MRKIKTNLNRPLIWASLALMVSACTTTSEPEDLGALVHTDFSEKIDGSAYHSVMGLSCPAEIDGMSRTSTHVYNDAGSDVSCNYVEGARNLTLYLSQYGDDHLSRVFGLAEDAVDQRFSLQGFEYNEELSSNCSSESIDAASVLAGFSGILSGENTSNEVTVSSSPSSVFVNADKMTLVIVDEMFEKEFFKVRYSGPYQGEISVKENCALARKIFLDLQKSTKVNRGIPLSEEDKILDLMPSN